jgi:hypothetical protein
MAMQSFCVVQRWQATNEEVDRGVGEFSFALEWPNGNRQTMPPTAMPPPGKAVHGANLNFVLKFVGFPLQAKGEYKFITYINGEHVNAVSFYVVLAADAAALLQPKPKIGFKPS